MNKIMKDVMKIDNDDIWIAKKAVQSVILVLGSILWTANIMWAFEGNPEAIMFLKNSVFITIVILVGFLIGKKGSLIK